MTPKRFLKKYGKPRVCEIVDSMPKVIKGNEKFIIYNIEKNLFYLDFNVDQMDYSDANEKEIRIIDLRRVKDQIEMILGFGGIRKAQKRIRTAKNFDEMKLIADALAVFMECRRQ
ncbi:hypothetical protein [Acinetobacter sp. ANC 3813]|uniref:hypothetical protein n=1 Tax=Acinetobacter sp. ANC 3813 TaxID=1977873 RepID=UPI000A33827B|nr:hypothetical protein [Acinetobacter sp. ANC 3813]OTG87905.1 hypothetical protein B9T34_16355 [Acinetobacter sp. ANC 3813]